MGTQIQIVENQLHRNTKIPAKFIPIHVNMPKNSTFLGNLLEFLQKIGKRKSGTRAMGLTAVAATKIKHHFFLMDLLVSLDTFFDVRTALLLVVLQHITNEKKKLFKKQRRSTHFLPSTFSFIFMVFSVNISLLPYCLQIQFCQIKQISMINLENLIKDLLFFNRGDFRQNAFTHTCNNTELVLSWPPMKEKTIQSRWRLCS